ncbi:MAG: transglutaminase family protein [Galactobacter sp.]
MRYRVWHSTEYGYSDVVQDSLGVVHLGPRRLPWQQVITSTVEISPKPLDVDPSVDHYGNQVTYFHLTDDHDDLKVVSDADVLVTTPAYSREALAVAWEDARPLEHPELPGAWEAAEFALESPRVQHLPDVEAYAVSSFTPGRALGEVATEIMHRIFTDFRYDGEATSVTSTVGDVLGKRAGVCQDFAHLALSCLRSQGLAARYVSGYLATTPAPGQQHVFGADASHAWLAVWVPGSGEWLAIDPTNDQWVNDRYVTVAWGRDYDDVAPVRGIITTEAKKSTLDVSVDVGPLDPVSGEPVEENA